MDGTWRTREGGLLYLNHTGGTVRVQTFRPWWSRVKTFSIKTQNYHLNIPIKVSKTKRKGDEEKRRT